jgi:hypothetical protein
MRARIKRVLAASVAGSALTLVALAASATAANSPTYRDCSLSGGLDPDFVQLRGAKPNGTGLLVAPRRRKHVTLEASESPNQLDQLNHVSLVVAVYKEGRLRLTLTGTAMGKVALSVPLPGPRAGRRYRIGWTARFDNGFHGCPSSSTPQNTSPRPFVVKVKKR